jgi:hypothetical protein
MDAQTRAGVRGAVGEIGIHHGRLFLLLDRMRADDEKAFAIDVFGEQNLNLDRSGRGDEAIFQRNLARYGRGGRNAMPVVFRRDSTTLSAEEIIEGCGGSRVRFFSIDGGHTPEVALSDLRLADACLAPDGVAALDDFLHPMFPGVASGLSTFLAEGPGLVPFAVSRAKAFLARPARAAQWRNVLMERCSDVYDKEATLFGYPVAAFGVFRTRVRLKTRLGQVKRRLAGVSLADA